MKKLLISVLVVLLLVLTYFLVFKNVKIASWTSTSINDIKALDENLNTQIEVAKQTNNQEYPQSIGSLEDSIKSLKVAKAEYESKLKYVSEDVELGTIHIKQYKIERLWIALANYAEDEGVELKLDLLDTNVKDVYDLNVTVTGEYMGVMDFIYDVEKDDTLGFKILSFKLNPHSITTTTDGTTQTTTVDVNKLTATFTIEGVGVDLN